MSIQTRLYLKSKFNNGNVPFQEDFWDLIDTLISKSEDGLTIFKNPDGTISLGIGLLKVASAPLSIKRTGPKEALISFHDNNENPVWGFATLNQAGAPGFNLVQVVQKNAFSRLFVDDKTGYVGIGTEKPGDQLHVEGRKTTGGAGIQIKNSVVAATHPGWFLQHLNDNTFAKRNGAFIISDDSIPVGKPQERLIIMPQSGKVGIAEKEPDTLLHVSRPGENSNTTIAFKQDTGIAQFGTVTKSVLADFQGFQARQGTYIGQQLNLTASALHLQRLGGDTIFHGATDIDEEEKVIIKTDGRVGIGVLAPAEKLHIDGGLIIGSNTAPGVAGAIRWSGTDFEGHDGTNWVSMTAGNASTWTVVSGTDKIYYNPADPMVGIGIAMPTAALHVVNDIGIDSGNSLASKIVNTATASEGQASDNRIGLDISCSGLWSNTEAAAKSIGLVVSSSGAGNVNANLAAVLSGNVSIGPVNSGSMVGTGGTNVLVLQTGIAPSTPVGGNAVTNGGVQIYSENVSSVSTFTLKNGNGNKIQLFKGAALTPVSSSTVDATYGTEEANVINTLRTRVTELETRLIALGLLAAYVPPPPPPPVGGGDPQA